MYVYANVHTCKHAYMRAFMHSYMYTYIHAYVCLPTRINPCSSLSVFVCVCDLLICLFE